MACISKLGFWQKIQDPHGDQNKNILAEPNFFIILHIKVLDPTNPQDAGRCPPPPPGSGVHSSVAVGPSPPPGGGKFFPRYFPVTYGPVLWGFCSTHGYYKTTRG